ncbi:MAG: lysostaphin resistance A-like protein [Halobacteriales archaeon]
MERESSPRDKLRAVGAGIGIGVGGLLLGGVLTLCAILLVRAFIDIGPAELIVLSLLMTQGIGLGSAAVAYLRWRGVGLEYISARVPSLSDLVWVVVAYVVALGGVWLVGVLVTLADAPTAENQVTDIAIENPEVLLVLIPGSFLLIGPGEELLFRGIVQARIREAFGPVPGVTIASVIFAAVHFVALSGGASGRLVTVGVLLVPSLVLGAAYEYTGNLAVPALIHGAYNATLFTALYAVIRYGDGLPESAALI